jgi:hypothetical protein
VSPTALLPPSYATSRDALHRLAVYVLWPARTAADGRIRLRPMPGGFGFGPAGDPPVSARVEGLELVVEHGGDVRRAALTSIAAAAALAGIEPGLAAAKTHDVPAPGDIDAPLAVDEDGAFALAEWFAFAADVLGSRHRETRAEDAPSDEVVLWPEHFDCAFEAGREEDGLRATYGVSPGDRNSPEPYLYVAPWVTPAEDPFWNATGFGGRWLKRSELGPEATAQALEFFREARGRLLGG